ncbi:hypothetical protein [Roseateles sp.]|uniref:hypothetical protein n=1 Tax=Roseateles sp. TaxID=1971397 RepID=UPI0035A15B67
MVTRDAPARMLRRLTALLLLLTLAACGGGGGGSGSESSSELRFGQLSPGTLTASYKETGMPAMATLELTTTYTGVPGNGAVYVVVVDPDGLITQASPGFTDGKASLTLQILKTLTTGRYTQPLTVRACKDPACKAEYGGSPQVVQKDLKVEGVTLSQSTFDFAGSVGAGAPAQTLSVQAPAGVDFLLSPMPVERTDAAGVVSTVQASDVFEFTRQGNNLVITPKATWAGRYVMRTQLQVYEGYAGKPVTVTYNVAGTDRQPLTLATGALNVTAPDYTPVTATIDLVRNTTLFFPTLYSVQISGIPDPASTGWVQLASSGYVTDGAGRPVWRMTLKFDRCGTTFNCLGIQAGTYPLTATIRVDGYGTSWTYAVPITYTAR